jgi:hypothetical protein
MKHLDFMYLKAHELAHLMSGEQDDSPHIYIFTRQDGINIPPGTQIKVTVTWEHKPPHKELEGLFAGARVEEPEGVTV